MPIAGIHFSFSNTLTFPYPSLHGNQKQSKPEAEHPDRMMPSDSHYLDRLLIEEGGAVWSRTWEEEVGVHGPVGMSLLLRVGGRTGHSNTSTCPEHPGSSVVKNIPAMQKMWA